MQRHAIILKQCARNLPIRRRYARLTPTEVVLCEKLQKFLVVLAIRLRKLRQKSKVDVEEVHRLQHLIRIGYIRYVHLTHHEVTRLERPARLDRDIDSFCDSDCFIFFRFNKDHLHELKALLGFDGIAIFDNNETMQEEEVMLRGLYELASGETQYKIARNVFGRDPSSQSRALFYFIDVLVQRHVHLLQNNLQWWYDNGFFEQSAQAIGRMLRVDDENHFNLVSHFIDCNCLETDRVGGGPTEGGANAERWDPHVQRAFYNGWKSINGLKHQTVDDAYGFTIDCYGPTSLRRNDLALLRNSDINDRFARLQLQSEDDYVIFGDLAYKRQSHLRSYFSAAEAVEQGEVFNRRMKKLRISIEWNYGHQAALFNYLNTHYKMKLLKSSAVTKVFLVTALLRNLYTGYYGSQSSKYFDLDIPADFNYKYINGLPIVE